jgi:hypothetical protein
MHQVRHPGAAAVVDRLLECVQHEVRPQRRGDTPADNPARKDVDDEGHIDEAAPRGDIGEVRDPELIRSRRGKVAVDKIGRPVGGSICPRGKDPGATADRAPQAHLPHQSLDGAPSDAMTVTAQLPPNLPRAVDLLVLIPDPLDRLAQRVIALRPRAPTRGLCVSGLVPEVGRRGNRHDGADRLDPVSVSMVINEADHHFGRRSSSAWAKYAEAFRKISLARFSSRTSRSSSFNRWRSSVVRPLRWPVSRSACRTQRRRVSGVHPSLLAIEAIAAHCDGCSDPCSRTIRMARSRTSGEYRLGRAMGPILSRNEPSDEPGTIHSYVLGGQFKSSN